MFFKLLMWKFAKSACLRERILSVGLSQMQDGTVFFDNTLSGKSDKSESAKRAVLDCLIGP